MTLQLNVPPEHAEAVQSAVAAYNKADYLTAIPGLRTMTQLNPENSQAHFLFGVCLEMTSDVRYYPEMYEHFERAVNLAPTNIDALFKYGQTLLYSSRERQAEAVLQRLLTIAPDCIPALDNLAVALLEQGRFDDALPILERLGALAPENPTAKAELQRVRDAVAAPRDKRRTIARFPRSTKEFANLEKVIDDYVLVEARNKKPIISPDTKTFAMGSCFATNVARSLRELGLTAESVNNPDDINNTWANRLLIDWIVNGPTAQTENFATTFGEAYRQRLGELLHTSSVFVYSLGVAPTFFDKQTGAFVPTFGSNLHSALMIKNYDFRTTTVAENVTNLTWIIDQIHRVNPRLKVVLTVSPVPLKATFERESSIIADCISKSTLRVAAHEFLQTEAGQDCIYWPSFEIVRWLGSHVEGMLIGADDESPLHPNTWLIDLIMRKFVLCYADADVKARLRAPLAAMR